MASVNPAQNYNKKTRAKGPERKILMDEKISVKSVNQIFNNMRKKPTFITSKRIGVGSFYISEI
jgi:hypothetical protein